MVFFIATSQAISAQFITININIKPELSVTVEQNLDFGTLVTNSGLHTIPLGAVNSGVFSIRAYHTQNIHISIDTPDFLAKKNSTSVDRIPITLNTAFNNSGVDNQKLASVLESNTGYLPINNSLSNNTNSDTWRDFYLYIYGSIEIGNIANGIYYGQVMLSIEYD